MVEAITKTGQGKVDDDKYEKRRLQKFQANTFLALIVIICVGTVFLTRQHVFDSHAVDTAKDLEQDWSEQKRLRHTDNNKRKSRKADVNKDTKGGRTSEMKLDSSSNLKELLKLVEIMDAEVRRIKETGVIMETDNKSLIATKKLQDTTRKLLVARYGSAEPYRVRLELEFQETIPDFAENGPYGEIVIELAPSELVPHSIYTFLEIARNWNSGAFHRIAGHVLQVMVHGNSVKHLAFQEYSPDFPHKKGTVGYAGRPSGPAWYVSTVDNTKNHGPGSQQKHNPYEADSCFGKIVVGFDDVIQRIKKVDGNGFISDRRKHVLIKSMEILVPSQNSDSGYTKWKESL